MTSESEPEGAPQSEAGARVAPVAVDDDERGHRGVLRLTDRVVEKVAAQAVREVDRATGVPRRLLGQTLGRVRPDSQARTSASVDGQIARVTVSISVEYPAPVREVAQEVRARVVDRVRELCGITVVELDVDVPHFLTEQAPGPRVR